MLMFLRKGFEDENRGGLQKYWPTILDTETVAGHG